MEQNDTKGLVQTVAELCRNQETDEGLWLSVLDYFGNLQTDCSGELSTLLEILEDENQIPPLVVLQILSKNKHLKLGLVKGYVAHYLDRYTQRIDADLTEASRLREATQ